MSQIPLVDTPPNQLTIDHDFSWAIEELERIERRAVGEKKEIIVKLAKRLEGKMPTSEISVEINRRLKGFVSPRHIRECLASEYKDEKSRNNALKRKSKKLAAVPLLKSGSIMKRLVQVNSDGQKTILLTDSIKPDQEGVLARPLIRPTSLEQHRTFSVCRIPKVLLDLIKQSLPNCDLYCSLYFNEKGVLDAIVPDKFGLIKHENM